MEDCMENDMQVRKSIAFGINMFDVFWPGNVGKHTARAHCTKICER